MKRAINVVIYGDSVMKGTVLDANYRYHAVMDRYLDRFRERFCVAAKNRSRFGSTVERGRRALEQDIADGLDCDYVLLEFGGNDCNFNWGEVSQNPAGQHFPLTPLDRFEQAYLAMLEQLRGLGIRPLLMTLPPIDAERYLAFLARNGNSRANILRWLGDVNMIYRYHETYSNTIAQIAAHTGVPLVDVRSYFLDKRSFLELICMDGLHPSPKGYELIAQAFEEFVARAEA